MPIVCINAFRALSARFSKRHNRTSYSLQYNSLNEEHPENDNETVTTPTKGDESGKRFDGREKTVLQSTSPVGHEQS